MRNSRLTMSPAARVLADAGTVVLFTTSPKADAASVPSRRTSLHTEEKISACAAANAWANSGLRCQRLSVDVEIPTTCAASSLLRDFSTADTISGSLRLNLLEFWREWFISVL